MNGRYVRAMTDEWLGGRLVEYFTRVGFYGDPEALSELAAQGPQALAAAVEGAETALTPPVVPDEEQEALTREIAPLVHEKVDVLAAAIPMAGWFFRPLAFTPEALERLRSTAGAAETLTAAAAALGALEEWDVPDVETLVRELPALLEAKPKAVFAALRLGMSGQAVTPGLFESLWLLGRDQAVARLEQAAKLL
jgi:glutamyl-tRNA synthetase